MGNKDIGMVDGYRESAQSWKELLLDLKRRAWRPAPSWPIGDGALGFWKAYARFTESRVQRCWVHKTANVLNQISLRTASGVGSRPTRSRLVAAYGAQGPAPGPVTVNAC